MKTKLVSNTFIFIILLFSFSCNHKNTQNNEYEKVMLDSLVDVCRSSIFTQQGFENARKLQSVAERYDNYFYQGSAYKYMLLTALNMEQKDSIIYYSDKAKYYFNESQEYREVFNINHSLIQWEMQYGNPQVALTKAMELLESVGDDRKNEYRTYELISNVYNIMGELNQAEAALEKALEIRFQYNLDVNTEMPYVFLKGAQLATALGKSKEALEYCDSAEVYIQKYYNNSNNAHLKVLLNMNKVQSFLGLDKLDKAKIFLDSLSSVKESDKFFYYVQTTWASYYKKKGDYKNALLYNDTAISKFKETSNMSGFLVAQKEKVEILALMQNYKDAYELKVENTNYADSVTTSDLYRQLNELQTSYQVDRLKNRARQDALELRNTRTVVIFLVLICLLLFTTIIVMVRHSVTMKRKNKKLFTQYTEQDKQQEKFENIVRTEKKENSYLSLFERTELYLYESKAYLKTSISRESLAIELGTNRQYLTQAIQENKNMTFSEYINDFRLSYSRRLLTQNTDMSIDDVYIKAGFSNKSTFYRLFRQKYDLTPREFQKIAISHNS